MTFYDGENLNEIIKRFNVKNYNYDIEYLDGSKSNFMCMNENYSKILEEKMISDAIKRNEDLYDKIKQSIKDNIITNTYYFITFTFFLKEDVLLIACIFLVLLNHGIKKLFNNVSKLRELKKYNLYLSIKEDLEKEENKTILDILDFDKFYQNPRLNINNLDTYSLSDIKTLKKEVIKRNNQI